MSIILNYFRVVSNSIYHQNKDILFNAVLSTFPNITDKRKGTDQQF